VAHELIIKESEELSAKRLKGFNIYALLADCFHEGLAAYFCEFSVQKCHKVLEPFGDILRDPIGWLLNKFVLDLFFKLLEISLKFFEILHFQFG
jgi:hypothetical protein